MRRVRDRCEVPRRTGSAQEKEACERYPDRDPVSLAWDRMISDSGFLNRESEVRFLPGPVGRNRGVNGESSRTPRSLLLAHFLSPDAAHIKEDSDGGEPVVPNGIAMCAIHHRAFDSFVLGVRPDSVIEVRRDVLDEVDGPTLQTPRADPRR